MAQLIVNADDLSYGDDQTCIYSGQPFTGTATFYRENGSVESTVDYVDGVQCGQVRDWSEHGKLVMDAQVKNGAFHGLVRHYSATGKIDREETFEFGICTLRQELVTGDVLATTYSLEAGDPNYKVLKAMRESLLNT